MKYVGSNELSERATSLNSRNERSEPSLFVESRFSEYRRIHSILSSCRKRIFSRSIVNYAFIEKLDIYLGFLAAVVYDDFISRYVPMTTTLGVSFGERSEFSQETNTSNNSSCNEGEIREKSIKSNEWKNIIQSIHNLKTNFSLTKEPHIVKQR